MFPSAEEIAAELERQAQLFYRLFASPEDRAGYHKHLEWFAAGATFRQRALAGGNRCLTRWSAIQTDRGERQIGEMIGEGAFAVRSWDGNSLCTRPASPVFPKGIEPAFHVVLDNGEAFQCSGRHRVWCGAWSDERPPWGWVSIDQIVRASGVLRCWRRPGGWRANCAVGGHPSDGPPPPCQDSGQVPPPSGTDAPSSGQCGSRAGGAASKDGRSHAYPGLGPLSTLDDFLQAGALCEMSEGESALRGTPPISESLRECGMPRAEYVRRQGALVDSLLRLVVPDIALVPLCPPLYGGNRIVAVIPIGYKEIWDLSVEDTHNYIAAGVVHHNSGKSVAGAYEATCHLTGRYPAWWRGKRFDRPTRVWVAGDTSKTVRDIVQDKLWGPSGIVPKEHRVHQSAKQGLSDAIETAWVRHASGDTSQLQFKSYDQKREAFQGTEQDYIWLDEEPPMDIYTECLMRTMTTGGSIALTFTPLRGMSEVVLAFMPDGKIDPAGRKFAIQVTWDDAPHLSREAKDELAKSIPPYQLLARTAGVPMLGAGAIYPIPEQELLVDPFAIPKHWPRFFGVDVGWNNTAACWFAWDRGTDVLYLYDAYKRGQAEPAVHGQAIAARGKWIPGVVDPASIWVDAGGIKLQKADNEVEKGIDAVYRRLSGGRMKVFRSCSSEWLAEFRMYRRDDKGKPVKEMDHLMDAMRYAVVSGLPLAKTEPEPKAERQLSYEPGAQRLGWMS